jgi:hypothetical protein
MMYLTRFDQKKTKKKNETLKHTKKHLNHLLALDTNCWVSSFTSFHTYEIRERKMICFIEREKLERK